MTISPGARLTRIRSPHTRLNEAQAEVYSNPPSLFNLSLHTLVDELSHFCVHNEFEKFNDLLESLPEIIQEEIPFHLIFDPKTKRNLLHWIANENYIDLFFVIANLRNVQMKEMIHKHDHFGATPLFYAIANENKEIAKILMDYGSDVERIISFGVSALEIAISMGTKEMVELVVEHGADINRVGQYDYTPLYLAIYKREPEIIQLLIKQGVNIHMENNRGITPLKLSQKLGYAEIEFILAPTETLRHSLHIVEKLSILLDANLADEFLQELNEIPENLIKKIPFQNVTSLKNKNNILHWVCIHSYTNIFKFLKSKKVNFKFMTSCENRKRKTPLFYAILNHNLSLVRFLFESDKSVRSLTHDGKTSLQLAILNNNYPIVKFLVDHSHNLDEKDNTNKTALYYALMTKQEKMVRYLVLRGANTSCLDEDKSAFHLARANGMNNILNFLLLVKCYGKNARKGELRRAMRREMSLERAEEDESYV